MGTVLSGLRAFLSSFHRRPPVPTREETAAVFREKYNQFQSLLESNTELLKICSEMEAMVACFLSGAPYFDPAKVCLED